ncbi:MAG TPA: hypothetical protein VEC57_00235 [Candidatus Limnocylindrales bacterium]|nr:hypothetical protein [Candidatus Limnocylindrales bacterium]
MKATDRINDEGEDALQEISHELEQIAVEIRNRGMRGRMVGDVAGAARVLRELTQRVELLTHCD